MKSLATLLMLLGLAGCVAAAVLATLAARRGLWLLWGINGFLLLACAATVLVNYRIARKWSGTSPTNPD